MKPKIVLFALLLTSCTVLLQAEEPDGAAITSPASDEPTSRMLPGRSGGTFGGTLAYDNDVGYDFGPFDDNGYASGRYRANRGKKDRMPGNRSDPGDIDFADFYRERYLIQRSNPQQPSIVAPLDESHKSAETYWRSSRHLPLRYDDTAGYLLFHYEIGGR